MPGPTYTVKAADQHSGVVTQTGVTAQSMLTALVIVINNQLMQGEIQTQLNPNDTLTVTVTSP